MNKSESIVELAKAMAKAQGEIENASKNAKNPHFRSKYADLAEVLNTVRPVMSANGISISQFPAFEQGIASVETIVMHSSGEWMSGVSSAPVSKQDAQGVGSALTYLRRYSLAAIAGIAQEDDDANSAVGGQQRQQQPQRQQQAPAQQAPAQQAPAQMDAAALEKAIEACKAAPDKATLTKYYQMAQQRGATADQLAQLNEACTARITELGA